MFTYTNSKKKTAIAEELLAIRNGEMPWEEVNAWRSQFKRQRFKLYTLH
ncbi:MAG: hypothetical protein AB4206_15580 [Xenococcaceae cyanobacterium]